MSASLVGVHNPCPSSFINDHVDARAPLQSLNAASVGTALQSPSSFQCHSGITALGSLYPGSWILGGAFLQNFYTMFDYGSGGKAAGGAASQPRVGIAALNAAEQAAQAALFNQGLAAKTSAAGCWLEWTVPAVLLAALLACLGVIM